MISKITAPHSKLQRKVVNPIHAYLYKAGETILHKVKEIVRPLRL